MADVVAASAQAATSYILGANASQYRVEYNPPSIVESFSSLPRFSRDDDFSKLFSNDPEDVRDYSLGLAFLALFIICFFTVWSFVLCLFKMIGPKYLGVLSGFPFQQEGHKSRAGRVTLIFSSISVIVLAILVVTKGLTELQTTADTISMTNQDVITIHREFTDIANNLRSVSERAVPVRDQLVTYLQEDICPLQPGSEAETNIRAIGADTLVAVTRLQNFVADHLDEIDVALDQVDRATTDVANAASQVQFDSAIVTAVMFPYLVIPAFLVVAAAMGWNDVFSERYYIFVAWFIIPLMCLMTAFAFLGAGWAAVSVEGNSDFCSPTPESTIDMILQQYNLQSGQLYYDLIAFYSRQCNVEVATNPWIFLEVYYEQLGVANLNLTTFVKAVVANTPDQLSQECGIEFSPILELLNSLAVHTTILLDTTLRSMNLVGCPNIVPLYTHSVYSATCQYSIVGATWIFSCSLLMSFFGMLCIMFRGAYYPIGYFYFAGADDGKSLNSTSESDLDDDGDDNAESGDDEEEEAAGRDENGDTLAEENNETGVSRVVSDDTSDEGLKKKDPYMVGTDMWKPRYIYRERSARS